MNRNYLAALLSFAEREGYQNLPVEKVLQVYKRTMKNYCAPKIRQRHVKTPAKFKIGYSSFIEGVKIIIARKKGISELLKKLGIQASVYIGGSLALKCQVAALMDRDVHDIDLIITPEDEDNRQKLIEAMLLLCRAGVSKDTAWYPMGNSYIMGSLWIWGREFPINIILSKECTTPTSYVPHFLAPFEVFKAKKSYIEEAKKKHIRCRAKDIIDFYKASL